MSSLVQLVFEEEIATITLNRPEKLNALNPEMLELLESACAEIEAKSEIRVVLLTGAGEKAFCVGADIGAWSSLAPLDMWRNWVRNGHRVFNRIANLRQPVIAAINGYAFGGGLELALAADLRFAVDDTEFAMPEVKIATVPGWAGSSRLPKLIGDARAKQMIFSGAGISAKKAESWGLINECFSKDHFQEEVLKLARTIAENAPISVQIAKQLVDAGENLQADLALEALAGALAASTQDGREGVEAFRAKRPPQFKGE